MTINMYFKLSKCLCLITLAWHYSIQLNPKMHTEMPENESLKTYANHTCTCAVHL